MRENKIGSIAVATLVAKLGSNAVTPGSGAAGAIALALAAACASKALAITAKHRSLSAELAEAAQTLSQLQEEALRGAEEDADHFKEYLQHRNPATAEELRQTDRGLIELCEALREIVSRVGGDVHPSVVGDITAARALVTAAAAIHRRNEATT
jgi:formiminotetrahydrofolate cyclodeaminase